jgi:hypothetical protein
VKKAGLLAVVLVGAASLLMAANPWSQTAVQQAPGVFWDPLVNKTGFGPGTAKQGLERQCDFRRYGNDLQLRPDGSHASGTLGSSVQMTINYVDGSLGNWTNAQMTYVTSLVSNLCQSPWWQQLNEYVQYNQVPVTSARSLSSVCFEVIGTTHNGGMLPALSCSQIALAMTLNLDASGSGTGCSFPIDDCCSIFAGAGASPLLGMQFPGGATSDNANVDSVMRLTFIELGNWAGANSGARWSTTGRGCETEPGEPCGGYGQPYLVTPNGGVGNWLWTDPDSGVRYGADIGTFWNAIGGSGTSCYSTLPPDAGWWTTPCKADSDCPAWSAHCDHGSGHCAEPTCYDGIKNQAEVDIDVPCVRNNVVSGTTRCTTSWDCNSLNPIGFSGLFMQNCIGMDGGMGAGVCTIAPLAPCDAGGGFCNYTANNGFAVGNCLQEQRCSVLSDCINQFALNCNGDGSATTYTSCTNGFCIH